MILGDGARRTKGLWQDRRAERIRVARPFGGLKGAGRKPGKGFKA